MKKQKVLLKKLRFSKSSICNLNAEKIRGGNLYFLTDNGCGPEKSVCPDICPVSHNCPPPSQGCPTLGCVSLFCETLQNGCNSPTLAC